MRYIVFLLIVALLMVGLSLTQSPVKSVTSVRHLAPCASIPDKRAFIKALYGRIAQDELMPPSGKLALASLHVGSPTFAFRQNKGAVLKFDILDFPGSVEAYQATALLIEAGVVVADEFELCLNGIEVVFYQDKQRLWLVFRAVPPWRAKNISLVPLGRRGD